MDFMGGQSRPLEARMLLTVLKAAKLRQDVTAQPGKGRGLWLSSKLWHSITRYLEEQASQMETVNNEIKQKQLELEQLRMETEDERQLHQRDILELKAQVAYLKAEAANPLAELGALQAQMRAKQEAWDQHKHDLETQVDRLMVLMRSLGMFKEGEAGRTASSEPQSAAAEAMFESEVSAPDAQVLKIRELGIMLADARRQLETCRRRLAARSLPNQEVLEDNKRLKDDNERLLALLSQVPQYRELAIEISAECGSHYLPLEECLMKRGVVAELYTPLKDRPVAAPGALGADDPAAPPGGTQVVLDEQYHWVPREALQAGTALMRRLMPTLPTSQLMALVAELNKVWRDREHKRLAEVAAAHQQELQQLRETFHQRAPYEAVVAGQKITDLKRRMRAQAAQAQAAAAAAKGEQRRVEDDSKVVLQAGLSSIQDLSRQLSRLEARNKKLVAKMARQARALEAAQSETLCRCCIDRLLFSKPTIGSNYTATRQTADEPRPSALPMAAASTATTATTSAPQAAAAAASVVLPASAGGTDPVMRPHVAPPSPSEHFLGEGRRPGNQPSALAPPGCAVLSQSATNESPEQTQSSKTAPASEVAHAAVPSGKWGHRAMQTVVQPYSVGDLTLVDLLPSPEVSCRPYPDPAPRRSKAAADRFVESLAATIGSEKLSGLSISPPGGRAEQGGGGDGMISAAAGSVGGRGVAATGVTATEPSAASLAEWRRAGPAKGSGGGGGLGVKVNVHAAPSSPLLVAAGRGQHRSAPVRVSIRFPRQDVSAV